MDVLTGIETVGAAFAGVITAMGGYKVFEGWYNRKQNQKMKEAEVDKANVEAEKSVRDMYEDTLADMRREFTERINELHSSLTDSNKRNTDLLKSGARKDEIIEDKTAKIRELNDVIFDLQKQLINKEKELSQKQQYIDWLKLWHCSRESNDCSRRKPPQPIPLKYVPMQDFDKRDEASKDNGN